jgi:uncharacterized protein with HEPN domain
MLEKDEANLLAIVDSAEKILRYSENFTDADDLYHDERSFDAVLMNFMIVGEAVTKLSADLLGANPHVPWANIRGLRNIIAHDYFGIDAEEIWETIQKHIPQLITDLEAILTKKSG